jgi:hypothetical protein
MKTLIIVFLSLSLWSCTPQKRLARLLNQHPELNTTDTLTLRDTITTQTIKTDTLVLWSQQNHYDTITVKKEKLIIQLIKQNDTLRIKGECTGDTIFTEKRIITTKVMYESLKPTSFLCYIYYGVGFLSAMLFFVLIKIIK